MTRTYHHGNLRAALIDAAVGLAREDGPDAVVLREMARVVGVSHNAAYRHFADRNEVLAEVAAYAMNQLEEAMLAGIASVRSRTPQERARRSLNAVGRAYVTFALANPGLFAIAFAAHVAQSAEPEPSSPESDQPTGPYGVLNDVLDQLAASGAMPAERRPGAEITCWAGVHGFAQLHLNGPLYEVPAEIWTVALDDMLATIERGLVTP